MRAKEGSNAMVHIVVGSAAAKKVVASTRWYLGARSEERFGGVVVRGRLTLERSRRCRGEVGNNG